MARTKKPAAQREEPGSRRVTFSEPSPAAAPPALPSALAPPTPLPGPGDEEDGAAAFAGNGALHASSAANGPSSSEYPDGPAPRGWYARFQAAVKSLKHEVLALYYAIHDPRTPWTAKLLPWFALAYALSPLDLIPDFIPVLGFLDDMLLLPALLWIAVKLIPAEIMEDARAKAHSQPLMLHRNWVAATLVFLMWTALILLLAHWGFRRWADAELLDYEWAVLAGTGGVCTIVYVTWMVTRLQHERRRRDEWNQSLNASLLPAGEGSA